MQNHEMDAWLGPARADLTDEQAGRLTTEAASIAARYPDPDEQEERDAALSATVQYLLGETRAVDAFNALSKARRALREAMAAGQQVATMLVTDGTSEVVAARDCGIDRMTLRKALGK